MSDAGGQVHFKAMRKLAAEHQSETAVAEKNVEAAKAALHTAIVEISKAGSKGVYHKNTCSRKISRLTKAVNEIA